LPQFLPSNNNNNNNFQTIYYYSYSHPFERWWLNNRPSTATKDTTEDNFNSKTTVMLKFLKKTPDDPSTGKTDGKTNGN
jgi:hypothetical protein